jgi:hypothetical protein
VSTNAGLPVYPDVTVLPGLGYNVKWSPKFYNMKTATTASGADIDVALAQYPLHDFELTYEFLRSWDPNVTASLEFRTMMGFHLMLGGSVGRFCFKNVDDYCVSQQLIGTGDGATTTFTLARTYGAQGYTQTEPVGLLNTSEAFNAYLNGSSTPVNPSLYSLNSSNPCAQIITFATAPTNGYAVSVDMSYFYYCKFSENNLDFEKFMFNLWSLNKVQIHSCRPGA